MTPNTEPKLAAPGAGLPLLELVAANVILACQRWTGSRAAFTARFIRERELIRAQVASCKVTGRGCRILISRPPGLEDSSRFWSVWMTLDHLRIVNDAFSMIITALARDTLPAGHASTAAVKPSADVGEEIEAAYETSCAQLIAAVERVADLKTKLRYVHPWFGAMDAAGWQVLAAGHMAIHREQIARIIKLVR